MAIVSMDTNNPLGQRPFRAMSGMEGTWDLREHPRSWIVRDTESAPIEHMRVPPELLGMQVPVAAELYRPGAAALMGMAPAYRWSSAGIEPLQHPGGFFKPASPQSPAVRSLLTPGGTTPPIVPTVAPQEKSFGQIIPTGSPLVAIGPGASTQNLVPSDTTVAHAAPSLTSIVAGGQPATSAVSTAESWLTDPMQDVIPQIPNWASLLGVGLIVYMMKGKR